MSEQEFPTLGRKSRFFGFLRNLINLTDLIGLINLIRGWKVRGGDSVHNSYHSEQPSRVNGNAPGVKERVRRAVF